MKGALPLCSSWEKSSLCFLPNPCKQGFISIIWFLPVDQPAGAHLASGGRARSKNPEGSVLLPLTSNSHPTSPRQVCNTFYT